MLNASCQSGGHYLGESSGTAAFIAAHTATLGLKDDKMRTAIVTKVVKQYLKEGKNINRADIPMWSQYATGGVPSDLRFAELDKLVTEAKTKSVYDDDMTNEIFKRLTLKEKVDLRKAALLSTKTKKSSG